MKDILIFAGTTEGRVLAGQLSSAQIPSTVCVATEYGESLLPEGTYVTGRAGRMNRDEMETFMKENAFACVVDATHPYAREVSDNIRAAAGAQGLSYYRLLREETQEAQEGVISVSSVREAARFLKEKEGKILAATGSKELAEYTCIPNYKERVFARVLSTKASVLSAGELGFEGRNLICMQGPFSEEMNYATMKQFGIDWLVTKAAGTNGGYGEKLRAARRAGAGIVVVGHPKEEGLSYEEVLKILLARYGKTLSCAPQRLQREKKTYMDPGPTGQKAVLVSLGTGSPQLLTGEAQEILRSCDAMIGARRMLEAANRYHKPEYAQYDPEQITAWIRQHPEYRKIAVVFSGDIGYYSGAKKLRPMLKAAGISVEGISGISSLVYFAARIGKSWDDAKMMSMHGRSENLISAVREHKTVFSLLGGKNALREVCSSLIRYGFDSVTIYLGENLSYPAEKITKGTPAQLEGVNCDPLAVVCIINEAAGAQVVTHGIADEAFLRGKVPMTKYEVRAVSLSRMELTKQSVVYDIGAGTGSITVEAARMASEGMVYAIEKNPEAVSLLKENKIRFAVSNVEIIEGLAPEALADLPAATHAFIGGSSGNMKAIVKVLLEKNPCMRIVVNAIALETVAETMQLLKELPVEDVEVSQIASARGKRIGGYEMMMGQNPVVIISFRGKKDA